MNINSKYRPAIRRIIAAAAAAAVAVAAMIFPASAVLADEQYNTFDFAAINTSIQIPKEFVTFTRTVTSADPNLSKIEASADQLRVMMEKNNLYLEAFPDNLSYEIILGGIPLDNAKDYNDLSESELADELERYTQQCRASESDTVYSVTTYKNNTSTYFVVDFNTVTDVTVYARKYYTVIEGCGISVALQTRMPSSGDANDSTSYVFDKAAEARLKDIVDRVSYRPMHESITDSPVFTELFGYISGIAITIGALGLILFLLIRTTKKPDKL